MHNRQKTARVFWDAMSKDELAAAVVAYKLLTSLAKRSFHKEEVGFFVSSLFNTILVLVLVSIIFTLHKKFSLLHLKLWFNTL